MQEEVTNKTVTFVVQTAKFSANIIRRMMEKYLNSVEQNHRSKKAQKQQEKLAKKREPPQGRIKVKDLAKQNAGMENYEIANKELKRFEKYARKYGINYAVKKDKSKDPPVYLVFFKGRDRAAIDAAFRDFTGEQLRKKNKNRVGIRKKLALYRAAAKNQKKARDKNRQQVR